VASPLYWIEHHSGFAAWLQAIGSIAAVLATWIVTSHGTTETRRLGWRQERRAVNELITVLSDGRIHLEVYADAVLKAYPISISDVTLERIMEYFRRNLNRNSTTRPTLANGSIYLYVRGRHDQFNLNWHVKYMNYMEARLNDMLEKYRPDFLSINLLEEYEYVLENVRKSIRLCNNILTLDTRDLGSSLTRSVVYDVRISYYHITSILRRAKRVARSIS